MNEQAAPAIEEVTDRADVARFAADWDRLAASQPIFTPTASDMAALLADIKVEFRLFVVRRDGAVAGLALWSAYRGERTYWLGSRRLLRLPLRMATPFGGTIVGDVDPATAAAILQRARTALAADLVAVTDLPAGNALFAAAEMRRGRDPLHVSRLNTTRRLITLPATMDAYWRMLRPSTRRAGLRDVGLFERRGLSYRLFTGRDALDDFLPIAAGLSARTYQIEMGHALRDTPDLRARFARQADEGRLRCYLAYVDGAPAAFFWGDVAHGIFYFRATGYDPVFANVSAGRAILTHVIRELIESKAARQFDFGSADMSYKQRFSTDAVPCVNILLGRWSKPRSVLAIALTRGLEGAKTVVARLRAHREQRKG